MKKRVILSLTAALFIILSCSPKRVPLSREAPHNNETYRVEYLFEHDGCKVYRFWDYDCYVYFTNCKGEATAVTSDTTRVYNLIKVE